MGENSDEPDALLNKLDSLMKSGRPQNRRDTPPVLTEELADDQQGPIPTLTNAIGNRRLDSVDSLSEGTAKVQDVVVSRLVASIDREITELSAELPALQDKLAALHRSLKLALPQLVSMRWDDNAIEDDDMDAAHDTGPDPDSQA